MVFEINIMGLRIGLSNINQSQANVPIIEKPSGWFLLAKYLKNTCGRVTF